MDKDSAENHRRLISRHLILPGVYVGIVLLTYAIARATSGGAYYRILGLCPPAGSVGMVFENEAIIVGAFLAVGTPWWYLVGRIGWDAHEHRRGPLSPIVGAAICALTCFVSTAMTVEAHRQDVRDAALNNTALAQYWLVAVLCLGALASTAFALGDATRRR